MSGFAGCSHQNRGFGVQLLFADFEELQCYKATAWAGMYDRKGIKGP